MADVHVRTSGGHSLRAALASALKASGVTSLKVGFFKTAKYPDGTQVAAVAAWNEFGTRTEKGGIHIPERPFFRQALKRGEEGAKKILLEEIDPLSMSVNESLGDLIGLHYATEIQKRIVDLREPPNAPSTVERKGSSNPLVDTGFMRQSVTYLVKREA